MNLVETDFPRVSINDRNEIDGEFLITERASAARPRPPINRCVSNPPLTLYGAYRQGIDDYFARRPNPYRSGSRLAAIWYEGRMEAFAGRAH